MDLDNVGEFFTKRFRKEKIFNNADLLERTKTTNKSDLAKLLTRVFQNKRKNKRVGLDEKMYRVREINIMGYNSTLAFLKSHRASKAVPYLKHRRETQKMH